jgi:hypothetical protein
MASRRQKTMASSTETFERTENPTSGSSFDLGAKPTL